MGYWVVGQWNEMENCLSSYTNIFYWLWQRSPSTSNTTLSTSSFAVISLNCWEKSFLWNRICIFTRTAVKSKVTGCNKVLHRLQLPLLPSAALNTPWSSTLLNALTLSDALCNKITHTQPCIRLFYVHVNVGRSGSWWQPNSWGAPPTLLKPMFVCAIRQRSGRGETNGNPLNKLRFLGTVKRFVQSIQIWWSFPCSSPQLSFCGHVWIMSPLYLSHLVSFSVLMF